MDLCRVDFALIPDNPLYRAVIDASQAITDEFYYNANVIDDKNFPPHLSLHICPVPPDALAGATDALKAIAANGLPGLIPTGVERSDGGYVMLNVEATDELMRLHEAVLAIAAEARKGLGRDKYGSPYIRNLFDPHISLAKVEYREQARAVTIGREALGDLGVTRARSLDLCDIGERSERWDVLVTLTGG